jgi:hypothetical protein
VFKFIDISRKVFTVFKSVLKMPKFTEIVAPWVGLNWNYSEIKLGFFATQIFQEITCNFQRLSLGSFTFKKFIWDSVR